MGTQYFMTLDEAYQAVQFHGEMYGIRNLWEALAQMEQDWDDLDLHDRTAFKMISRELANAVESEGGLIE
jgi:hypothetical protein